MATLKIAPTLSHRNTAHKHKAQQQSTAAKPKNLSTTNYQLCVTLFEVCYGDTIQTVFQLLDSSLTLPDFYRCFPLRRHCCEDILWSTLKRISLITISVRLPDTMEQSTAPAAATIPTTISHLLSVPGNSCCMDCSRRGPDWLSLQFGLLICLECAGKHRSLGVHITLVRSLRLDAVPPEQLEYLVRGGNARFTDYMVSTFGSVQSPILYSNPQILYYREILQARVQQREPVSEEEFMVSIKSQKREIERGPPSPASPSWIADNSVDSCMICKENFTLLFRLAILIYFVILTIR
jgi:hypothetical protein